MGVHVEEYEDEIFGEQGNMNFVSENMRTHKGEFNLEVQHTSKVKIK